MNSDLERRMNLCLSIGEECIQVDELRNLLLSKENPLCYDGFEPSGRVHIAQGIMKVINVNKLTQAGCNFVFWIADWFALLNNKMDGDLDKIQTTGKYMIEVWKAAGMDLTKVKFLWSSEEINRNSNDYWTRVMDISRKNSVSRIKRCCTIMGRTESDDMPASQIFYPCMQCADIFYLKADICQLGMDQRKVNMLAREYCDIIGVKNKPIIISHHMLPGLLKGQEKMSKSDPDSAIFMEDDESTIRRKIKKAFCPPNIAENNPCLEYMKYIVFPKFNNITVKRSIKNGGDIEYINYEQMEFDYISNKLHPGDLKNTLVEYINYCIIPIRKHFENDPIAKELLMKVNSYKKNN